MTPRVLVVFIDALGAEQLERFGETLSFLPHRRALSGVLGYSSGALATVLTGASGAEHGRMCLFAKRPEGAPSILGPLSWLGLLPRVVHERAALRRALGRALSFAAGLTGYVALHRVPPAAFEWLDLPERDDLFTARDVAGVPTFLGRAREAGLTVYASPWQLPEAERWAQAHRALRAAPPDLAFLYATELDGVLHAEGNDGTAARSVRARLAAHVERAREAMLRGGGPLLTLLVGDHGMADVRRTIDPRGLTARLPVRAFVDSTMLRVWGEGRALERARLEVERAKLPGQWLDAAALAQRGAPIEGAPYGSAIFLLEEGAIFAPSWVGGRARGMHGYDVSSRSATAALASDAPLPGAVTALTHLSPLVGRSLGLS
jgi:hypothetical protein